MIAKTFSSYQKNSLPTLHSHLDPLQQKENQKHPRLNFLERSSTYLHGVFCVGRVEQRILPARGLAFHRGQQQVRPSVWNIPGNLSGEYMTVGISPTVVKMRPYNPKSLVYIYLNVLRISGRLKKVQYTLTVPRRYSMINQE